VTDYGTHGWYISVCDRCGAEVGMSAQLYTRNDAETARCFVCEPPPAHPTERGHDPADDVDFDHNADAALEAIDDGYAAEMAALREKPVVTYREV
jgi:hypothetical protein